MSEREARVLAIDAGGTMTDTFIVDDAGAFVVGKAQTTPEDESIGFMESARDALEQWDSSPAEAFPRIASGIYSGTAMLNRVLSRTGRNIGAIVTGISAVVLFMVLLIAASQMSLSVRERTNEIGALKAKPA